MITISTLRFPLYFFVLALLSLGCHLEPTPDDFVPVISNCSTTPPEAMFDLLPAGDCDRPCQVQVVNKSSTNSTNFLWRFGTLSTSTDREPAPVTVSEAGLFTVTLIVQNAEGCADTLARTVQVNAGISKFAKVLDVSTGNVSPYGVAQRSDGKLHVLYGQNGVKSLLVNTLGNAEGNPVAIPSANISNVTNYSVGPVQGGFVVGGTNGSSAKTRAVTSTQQAGYDLAGFQFSGGAESYIRGVFINSDFDAAVTGYRKNTSGKFAPCFAKIDQTGAVVINTVLGPTANEGYAGSSIVQRPSGDYLVLASCQTGACASGTLLISLFAGGGYNTSKGVGALAFPGKIIRTTGDNYVIIGYTATGDTRLVGINSSLEERWRRDMPATVGIIDATLATDGHLVLVGTEGSTLYFEKIPDAATGSMWKKPFTLAGTNLIGISIVRTSDNGFAVLGMAEKSGETDLYLAKTDADGNSQ